MSNYQLNPSTLSIYSEKITLQVMCEHNGFNRFFTSYGWSDDDLAFSLGLKQEWDNAESINEVKTLLSERYQQVKLLDEFVPSELELAYNNFQKLKEYIELNETEVAIFKLAFHIQYEDMLDSCFELLGNQNVHSATKLISKLLQLDVQEVKRALNKNQKLKMYGLIEKKRHGKELNNFLQWGETLKFSEFLNEELSEDVLIKQCLNISAKPKLTLNDFEYIQSDYQMVLEYLSQVMKNQQKGVNILLHGKPGTGKTELATLLGEQLNTKIYTLRFEDDDGETLSGSARLNSCVLAQKLLENRNAMIIFDEIEDVFSSGLFSRSTAQSNKAWTNHFLENNNVPMIWISNDVGCMDNAFIRRFDMVFEMPMLPTKHKEKLIAKMAGEKLSAEYIRHFAQNADLSPAVLSRTLSVVSALNVETQAEFAEKALGIFNQTLQAQGFCKIDPLVEGKIHYNLDWVNCAENMHKISGGLKNTKRGRICCYGPAGTGKTAWANWLAQEIGRPALVRQGSDLLDKYVGGTEQKIAAAFKQAKENDMVLILDEVDTFLFARESGQRSWEHSQVNEMLTQIEKFEGLMIVSTNLMDNLDPAALRRFDLKVHFDYLNAEQCKKAAIAQVEKLNLPALSEQELAQIGNLTNLTMGDFAAVARRHRFAPFENTSEWCNAVEQECRIKPHQGSGDLSKWLI